MHEALVRSIAETAANVLGRRTDRHRVKISDEQIGLYLWHERGFRDHETLVALINHTRAILDRQSVGGAGTVSCPPVARPTAGRPSSVQLSPDLVTA